MSIVWKMVVIIWSYIANGNEGDEVWGRIVRDFSLRFFIFPYFPLFFHAISKTLPYNPVISKSQKPSNGIVINPHKNLLKILRKHPAPPLQRDHGLAEPALLHQGVQDLGDRCRDCQQPLLRYCYKVPRVIFRNKRMNEKVELGWV